MKFNLKFATGYGEGKLDFDDDIERKTIQMLKMASTRKCDVLCALPTPSGKTGVRLCV